MSEQKKKRGRPNIVGIEKGMGPLEARVLRSISDLPLPVTVRDVCDALSADGYFAYQGILNCMNRLVRKGILDRERRGTAFTYRPMIDVEELAAEVVGNVLEHMGGNQDRVICRVLDIDPDLGEEELAALRRRVKAASRKSKR